MKDIFIKITTNKPDDDWRSEVIARLSDQPGLELYVPADTRYRSGTLASAKEIIIALSSAGAFTALFGFLRSYMERDKHREVILQRDKTKLTIKGHSHKSEAEVLEQLIGMSEDAPLLSPTGEKTATKPSTRKK